MKLYKYIDSHTIEQASIGEKLLNTIDITKVIIKERKYKPLVKSIVPKIDDSVQKLEQWYENRESAIIEHYKILAK